MQKRGDQDVLETDLPTISFLPRFLVRQSLDPSFQVKPLCSRLTGAILLVDISGFTKLSKSLSSQGAWGLEQIQKHLNSFYSKIIEITDSHGGDVIKIAGDALLVLFRVESGFGDSLSNMMGGKSGNSMANMKYMHSSPSSAAYECVKCALRCVELSKSYDLSNNRIKGSKTGENVHKITLHCGISYGTLFDIICGGVDGTFEYLIAGNDVFTRMATCLQVSKSGEVCTDSNAYDLFQSFELSQDGHRITVKENTSIGRVYVITGVKSLSTPKSGLESVGSVSTAEGSKQNMREAKSKSLLKMWLKAINYQHVQHNTLVPFIPSVVKRRIEDDQAKVNCELRNCCVLFIGLHDVIFESEESLAPLQKSITVIQTACKTYQGFVRQFLVDDKGCVAILVFGAPGFTHNDDPVRATLCACDIQAKLSFYGFTISIGCTKGQVFCGDVGDLSRREYAFVGDIVNTAAHLMTLRRGVLCSTAIYESSAHRVEYGEAINAKIKGSETDVTVYPPVGPRVVDDVENMHDEENVESQDESIEGKILFREKQIAVINSFIKDMSTERTEGQSQELIPKTVFITGNHSSGKSALASVVLDAAKKYEYEVISTSADPSANSSYSSIVDLLDQIMRIEAYYSQEERTDMYLDTIFSILKSEWEVKSAGDQSSSPAQAKSAAGTGGKVLADFTEKSTRYYSLLNPILGINLEAKKVVTIRSQRTKNKIIKYQLLHLLTFACHERKLLLLVENMDRMDRLSIELIQDLCSMHHNIFICITFNESTIDEKTVQTYFRGSAFTRCVDLPPFTKEETKNYITMKSRGIVAGDSLVDALYTKTEGIPGYLKEAATLLSKYRTQFRPQMSKLENAKGEGNITSENIEGMVASQVDKLGTKFLNILKIASVIGMYFSERDILKLGESQGVSGGIKESLEAGQEQNIVRLISEEPKVFMFTSKMFRDNIYKMVPQSQAKKVHEDYARFLESTDIDKLDRLAPIIAHHYLLGINFTKAYDLSLIAARKNLTEGNIEFCIKMLDLCTECINSYVGHDKNRRMGQIQWQIGMLNHLQENYEKAINFIKSSLELNGFTFEFNRSQASVVISRRKMSLFTQYLQYRFGSAPRRNQVVPLGQNQVPLGGSGPGSGPSGHSGLQPVPQVDNRSGPGTQDVSRTLQLVFSVPDESNSAYVKLKSFIQLADSYNALNESEICLCYLIQAYDGSMESKYLDIQLDALVRIGIHLLVESQFRYADFIFRKLKEVLAQFQKAAHISMALDIGDTIIRLIWMLIISSQYDLAMDFCSIGGNTSGATLNPIFESQLSLAAGWIHSRVGPVNIGIQNTQKMIDLFLGLENLSEYSALITFAGLQFLCFGQGDREDIFNKLSILALNCVPSHTTDDVILSCLHMATLSAMAGYPLFSFEIADVITEVVKPNSYIQFITIAVVTTSLLNFAYGNKNGGVAKDFVTKSPIFVFQKETCMRNLKTKSLGRDPFNSDQGFVMQKITKLLACAKKISASWTLYKIATARLEGYVHAANKNMREALRCLSSSATLAKSVGDTYGLLASVVAMELLANDESRRTRAGYPDKKELMKKIGPVEYLDFMMGGKFLY